MPERPYKRICIKCGGQFYTGNLHVRQCNFCRWASKGKRIRSRTFWKNKKIVLERDEYRCQCCGCSEDKKRTNKLVAHHIDVDFQNNSPSNLIILCTQCHQSLHKKYTKYTLRRSNIYKLFADNAKFGEFGKNLIYGASKKLVKKQFGGKPKSFFKRARGRLLRTN